MNKNVINTVKAPAAIGPYVQAVQAGNILTASGQLGIIPETGKLPETVSEQAKQALANVAAILEEAGYKKEDVIKTTVYLADIKDFTVVNQVYEAFFGEWKPARSCVEIGKLPLDGKVEVEIIAVK